MRVPASTYRLQLTAEWGLPEATALVDQLSAMGVDWLYLSPLLQSEDGSDHGYDVVDHSRTDEARGGRAGLAELVAAARRAGLGVLYDIVPNHMGVSVPRHNSWWWELLRNGRSGDRAECFDVDWAAGGGRILLPVLGDGPDELNALAVVDGELDYHGTRFPIAPGTGDGTPAQVHDRQHYRLISWRRGDDELNYRRFFTITSLAGIRVEDPPVFAESHAEIDRWVRAGALDGVRVDHPDGLADPAGYLADLRALIGERYLVVEKILQPGETMPAGWDCQGTTGYEAGAALDRLFVDPAGRKALEQLDTELRGGPLDWAELTHQTRRAVADGALRAEVLRIARLMPRVDRAADAIAELLSSFRVYRSYLPVGANDLEDAVRVAVRRRPDLSEPLAELSSRLMDVGSELSVRFQQTSGMVMAKGVEDCAFYRWSTLTSLTEVGADPEVFSVSAAEFHALQATRHRDQPATMTTLSTHDSKRGEDVRARISVLSEIADEWADTVRRWLVLVPFPDGPLANLVWQAAVGAWPIERSRLHAYAEKAAREAALHTSWTDPDPDFENALHALVDACYDHPTLSAELGDLAARSCPAGWSNSLSAKLIQLTGPGVPDVYQGTERWTNSLADPDNRRPVDHQFTRDLLRRLDSGWLPAPAPDGAVKLLVTSRALRLRRDRPALFGEYHPLAAAGGAADHLVAFDRGGAVTLATRLPVGLARRGGWRDTTVELPPGRWRDVLSGPDSPVLSGVVKIARLLDHYPVALLESVA